MRSYLRPTAPYASSVLLPGDPARALALAQALLDAPRMANHARGLWGYTGATPSGEQLSVQASGIGGPSIAIVLGELAELGVERAIRIGSCEGLDPSIGPGRLVIAEAALAGDGASRSLARGERVAADPALTSALREAAAQAHLALVASTDLHEDPPREAGGAQVSDLGTAAALAAGARHGVAAASTLLVVRAGGRELGDEEAEEAMLELGRIAVAALNPERGQAPVSEPTGS